MKTIVTHISPDIDAITSAWLVKRFIPHWGAPEYAFVPAGSTLDNKPVDQDDNIIHVDTGLGRFDHHQLTERSSATKRVFEYLKDEGLLNRDAESVERMVEFVTIVDNFGEVSFPDPTSDVYDFCLHQLIHGIRNASKDDKECLERVFIILEGILQNFKNKVRAEKEIQEGLVLQTKWGKTLVMETKNEEGVKLALKMGFTLVVRKDPDKGSVRIKTFPDIKYDLTPMYDKLIKVDPEATWFLHNSKNMLLNGSTKNPNSVPSTLSVKQLVEIIKSL